MDLIESYKELEQLDDRHDLLVEMIKKYGDEPGVQGFLANWIPRNERAKHLLRIAEQNLNNPPADP